MSHPQVVPTNGTSVLVGKQHLGSKRWVSSSLQVFGCVKILNLRQTHCVKHVSPYSPRPREAYNKSINGTVYGPASSSLLEATEAWNLAFLSNDFENRLHHPDPYFTTNVRRTTQTLLDGSGIDLTESFPLSQRVASLLRLPAPRFVYLIHKFAHLKSLPMYTAYGEEWLATIEERSHLCYVDDWEPETIADLSQANSVLALIT
jgi:hypothetical protein